MYIKGQLNDTTLKPCPYCNSVTLLLSTVDYQKGQDDGFKVVCNCGWASRLLSKWYANKTKLINEWNSYILEGEFKEVEEGDGTIL